MPLFNRKPAQKIKEEPAAKRDEHDEQTKQNLVFHCQQAQGSPTGLVSDFSNVRELYQRVADCYDFPSDEVRSAYIRYERVPERVRFASRRRRKCPKRFRFPDRKAAQRYATIPAQRTNTTGSG